MDIHCWHGAARRSNHRAADGGWVKDWEEAAILSLLRLRSETAELGGIMANQQEYTGPKDRSGLSGAAKKTRTSTGFRPQRPQRCASTNSAMAARR